MVRACFEERRIAGNKTNYENKRKKKNGVGTPKKSGGMRLRLMRERAPLDVGDRAERRFRIRVADRK